MFDLKKAKKLTKKELQKYILKYFITTTYNDYYIKKGSHYEKTTKDFIIDTYFKRLPKYITKWYFNENVELHEVKFKQTHTITQKQKDDVIDELFNDEEKMNDLIRKYLKINKKNEEHEQEPEQESNDECYFEEQEIKKDNKIVDKNVNVKFDLTEIFALSKLNDL